MANMQIFKHTLLCRFQGFILNDPSFVTTWESEPVLYKYNLWQEVNNCSGEAVSNGQSLHGVTHENNKKL